MSSDARLFELEFLSRLASRELDEVSESKDVPRRDMIAHLLLEGMVNHESAAYNAWSDEARRSALIFFSDGQKIKLRINHKGRVRLAELKQALRTDREREPFGLLWAARYWERDLRIALLSASKESPIVLCFLDMNGLKAINDTHGHEAGDDAIRSYLRVIADNVSEVGDAYRCGGDEVVVIIPGMTIEAAEATMTVLLRQLGEENIHGEALTASCGIGVAVNPDVQPKSFREVVDKVQYQAKKLSKEEPRRRSVLAVEGREPQTL